MTFEGDKQPPNSDSENTAQKIVRGIDTLAVWVDQLGTSEEDPEHSAEAIAEDIAHVRKYVDQYPGPERKVFK